MTIVEHKTSEELSLNGTQHNNGATTAAFRIYLWKQTTQLFFFFFHTSTFQFLDKPWSRVSSFLPPVLAFSFYRVQG